MISLFRLPCFLLLLFTASSVGGAASDTLSDSAVAAAVPLLDRESLDNEILQLRRKELDTETRIERLEIDIQAVEKRWQTARESDTESRLLVDSVTTSQLETKVLWEQLRAYRTDLENASLLLNWYKKQRMILRLVQSAGRDTVLKIDLWNAVIDTLKPFESELAEECRWRNERLAETRFEVSALDTLLRDTTLSRQNKRLLRKRRVYLVNKAASDSILAVAGARLDSLFGIYRSNAKDALKQITIRQKTRRMYRRMLNIWSYELYDFDGKPLTVGKIVIALFVILFGLKTAQIISKLIARTIKRRSQLDAGIVDAGQKLFYYTFAALFTLYALHMIQVPLTAFTVVGGALALGFGFGSQNIVSNFISGIILLVERPVKTGDFIEVEASVGTVETIGLRSVRIRTQKNEHLIIPNSYLLEKPLVNWTLSDKIVRLELAVGVVYGSPVREVKRLLLAAVTGIDRINGKPEPFVIFSDFGDNALLFHLVFWSKIQSIIDKRMILSQLRFKIDDLFNQAGIIIAFPQRDVHLDTVSPLRVQIENTVSDKTPETET
jgi:potassium-dependent mechanosensitive channel